MRNAAVSASIGALHRVYVWEAPVRITHWAIALSILALAGTGFYIGHPFLIVPGEARFHFAMGTAKVLHFYAAIVFTLAVLARLLWMFLGNEWARWNQFLPLSRQRRRGLWPTIRFYLFLRPTPSPAIGHNPVAGATYVAVYLLCLVEIATGLGLYSVSAHAGSPMRAFAFLLTLAGGAQTARWIHHVVMWLLLGFMVHHIFSALLVSGVERNGIIDSIFSGYKFVDRETLRSEGRDD